MNLFELLGRQESDPLVLSFINRVDGKPERFENEDTDGFDVWFASVGVGLKFNKDRQLTTVFLYGPGNDEDAIAFAGELPGGVQFAWTRQQITSKLGSPTKTGRTSSILKVGQTVWWDRYDGDASCLHLQYNDHDGPLVMLTLMSRDSAP